MAEQDVKNAEGALAFLLNARRRAAAGLAKNHASGLASANSADLAESFAKLQRGVEAARKALDEEHRDPEYLGNAY